MKGLRIFLRTEEPLILSDGKIDGATHTALSSISGNKFLGTLATRWSYQHQSEGDPINHPEFQALFLNGAVSYGSATISYHDRKCLPMPLCLVAEKTGSQAKEELVATNLLLRATHTPTKEESVLSGYLDLQEKRLCSVPFSLTTHLNLHGTAFKRRTHRYETIDEKTPFITEFYVQDDYFDTLKKLIKSIDVFQMGKSRSAGYGTIRITRIDDLELASTHEVAKGEHTFTLLTTFVPDKSWQPPLDGFLDLVAKHLGQVTLVPEKTFCAFTRVEGFNKIWDAPRTTQIGLTPGSVICVQTAEKGVLPIVLGLNQQEGLGRYALDLPLLQEAQCTLLPAEKETDVEQTAHICVKDQSKLIKFWRTRSLLRLATEQAIDCVWNSQLFAGFFASLLRFNKPSQSQRGNVQRLILNQDRKNWISAFTAILGKQPGRQWKTVRVQDPFSSTPRRSSLDEIMLKLFDTEKADALIGSYPPFQKLPLLAGPAMTPGEETLFRSERHKRILLELLRRWEKEARAAGGEK